MKKLNVFLLVAVLVLGVSVMAGALEVNLPDESQTTTFTATVLEQADITVPATVTFTVNNVSASTPGSGYVSATSIVLIDGNALKISLKADAEYFTAATGGTVTWAASDISWVAGTWTNGGIGVLGELSTGYAEVATSAANASETSSTVAFTLEAKPAVDRAGNHTLVARWKFESLDVTP